MVKQKEQNKKLVINEQDLASLGWRTSGDQQVLYSHRLAVVGAGGAGGGLAVMAAREGMKLTVADPDVFDVSNLNRQIGSRINTVGVNKAKAVGDLASKIRGDKLDLRVFEEGMTEGNVDEILKDATLVVDAIDISRPDLSIILARKAREAGLPVFMGIEVGYGCMVTCFRPDPSVDETVERYFGIDPGQKVDQNTKFSLDQTLVHMPSYMPTGMLKAFKSGKLLSTPGVCAGVQILDGAMSVAINRWVLGYTDIFPQFIYPNLYVFDPMDGIIVVNANSREEHLDESLSRAGTDLISSGFSLPGEYLVAPCTTQPSDSQP